MIERKIKAYIYEGIQAGLMPKAVKPLHTLFK